MFCDTSQVTNAGSDYSLSALEAAAERVYSHMLPTPQYAWPLLQQHIGAEVFVKHENHTPIGCFKVRGGLNFMTILRGTQPCVKSVITATRGNHGQSLALAASRLGLKCSVVAPEGNNPEKNMAMEAFGANLIVHGRDFQEAYEQSGLLAVTEGAFAVGPFHPWLVQGVASYGLELMRAVEDLDTIFVPIGMGSGACSLIAARDALGLKTKIVGVVAEKAPAYALSFQACEPVSTDTADTMADGLACRVPNDQAFEMIMQGAANVLTVSDDEIKNAMRLYYTHTHNLAEGAGAAALAALIKNRDAYQGKRVAVVLTGGNVDKATFQQVLAEG